MKRIIFLFALLKLILLQKVQADCTLQINGKSPYILKEFGSKTLILKKNLNSITFKKDETLKAFCKNEMSVRLSRINFQPQLYKYNNLELKCDVDNQMIIKSSNKSLSESQSAQNKYYSISVSCTETASKYLYESEKQLPNCDNNMTYAIGYDIENVQSFITAGLCYDFETLSLKYYTYLTQRHSMEAVVSQNKSQMLTTIELSKQVGDIKTLLDFFSKDMFANSIKSKQQNNQLLAKQSFSFESLLQNINLRNELKEFEHLFNIVWWNTLRDNNWNYFETALKERTKSVDYLIYTGTSGIISVPTCNHSELLTFENNHVSIQAPEYIWSYMKSLDADIVEEFVVIAYNSPFFEYSNDNIFCKSMCDDIEWLKSSLFGSTHKMPSMGYMICCRPEDVKTTLTYFPMEIQEQQQLSKEDIIDTTTKNSIIFVWDDE